MRPPVTLAETNHPRYKYLVHWREDGRAHRRYFRAGEKQKAQTLHDLKISEMVNHGRVHGTIEDDERAAVIYFREQTSRMSDPPSLMACVISSLSAIKKRLTPITVLELVELRRAAAVKKGVHEQTMRDLFGSGGSGGRMGRFAKTFGERHAAELSAEEIDEWLDDQEFSDATRREMLVRLNGLFAVGIKKKHLAENPIAQIEMPKASASRAAILSIEECRALLAACPASIRPAVAAQLFAGARKSEAVRLGWEQVDFHHSSIRLTQRKGAGKKREISRHVPMLPALKAFMQAAGCKDGMIFPNEQIYRRAFEKARKLAGLEQWDENTMRHCFGSYRLADIDDLAKVQSEMGHSNARTTKEFYVNAVRKSEAKKFWALRPEALPPDPADRWRDVDWSRKTGDIARDLSVSPGAVSHARRSAEKLRELDLNQRPASL